MTPTYSGASSNSLSWADEIDDVEKWAEENNLFLNRTKSVEITFVRQEASEASISSSSESNLLTASYIPALCKLQHYNVLEVFSYSCHN